MVDDELYKDTGYTCSAMRCGTPDGQINSSVERSEIPSKNDQSNFGQGYDYQYWVDNFILVDFQNKKNPELFLKEGVTLDGIPEYVANMKAIIKETVKDSPTIKVQVIEVPEMFGYQNDNFPNNNMNSLIEIPLDNLVSQENAYDEDYLNSLIGKEIKLYFDGDYIELKAGKLKTVYQIDLLK